MGQLALVNTEILDKYLETFLILQILSFISR
ncbi:MAG: hypothetical protein ACLUI5_01135 [Fusicatenibacter saccharivorans]